MDYLRLVLLFTGLAVIAGIYLWSRRGTSADRISTADTRHEPSLGEGAFDALDVSAEEQGLPELGQAVTGTSDGEPVLASATADVAPSARDDLIIALTLLAPVNEAYSGNAIQAAAREAELVLSAHKVYQCLVAEENSVAIFSLASLLEPGSLDFSGEEDAAVPGLCLMLRLPGPLTGTEAFEKMLACGQGLATRLGGTLCNERRSSLTPQYLNHLREQILVFDHQSET